jgi:flagellar assembly protein FliH
MSSRIIAAGSATEARSWRAPAMDGAPPPPPRPAGPAPGGGLVTAGALADLQREAYDEAYRVGHREGLAAGERAMQERVQRLDDLIGDLARPFEQLDVEVEQELLGLAMALAKQLVRREIRLDPTQVIAVVREAVSVLPVSAREVRVHLHPEDAEIIRQYLAPTENERAWQVVEDPVMMRGGCQVVTPTSRVDARLETRLGRVLSELLGSERSADSRAAELP